MVDTASGHQATDNVGVRMPRRARGGPSPRRRVARSVLAVLCLGLPTATFLASPAAAAPGGLDTSFGTAGKVITNIGGADFGRGNFGSAVAVQADGKIVVVGESAFDFAVVRYNVNGSLDTSFDTDGKVTTDIGSGTGDSARAIGLQADGKIVAAGYSNNASGTDFAVVRYNVNGSLDTSFDTDGKVTTDVGSGTDDRATAVALQLDGKIVAAGDSDTTSGGFSDFAVVRYSANGSLDTSFDTDGKVTTDIAFADGATEAALQADGKIVVAGYSNAFGNPNFAVARYGTNGSLDTSFDTDGKVTTDVGAATRDFARATAVQADGKIVVAGYSSSGGNDFAVVRYSANGSLDTSFDTDGKVTTDVGTTTDDVATAIGLQADGKIVVAGNSNASGNSDFAVVRYGTNGSLDTSFDTDGKVTTDVDSGTEDFASAAAVQADGKIVVAGYYFVGDGFDLAVVRYEGDPGVIIGDASVAEGDFGTVNATFNVALFGPSTTSASVSFATANGTATAGSDYVATAGTLTFAPGETLKKITVSVIADGLDEANETFFVNLSAPSNVAVVVKGQGTGTIVDDDGVAGYWLDASDGGIFAFDVPFSGSTGAITLNKPIVGMAADPDGKGYWLVASDGGIFAFDAPFFGSTGAIKLNKPIVGMAATPSGKGYFLVASDGGIFAFGDALFKGSTGAIKLNLPIVGMAADPDGSGYFLVASDGGIFAFDAIFKGSTGATKLNQPIVAMAADLDGSGYFLVASDGGIFAFDAVFKGSTGAIKLNLPIVGMAADPDGSGYFLVASDGGIFAFDAVFRGSTGAIKLNKPIVGMAVSS